MTTYSEDGKVYTAVNTISNAATTLNISKICMICDESFSVGLIDDTRQICPNCKAKLKKIVGGMKDD